ncbi:FAD/NAD(P)-binding domain-containing protein [Rickenella mellea]|uniref:FAD/NAD(P)-binding domain-containing protein n=1 Tax=Rickenella mellea TaxID=50990 RepID=A0A4Y7PTC4_9AGAM|nr:FAD/NAD(P)-binding domain-containing protein [Rickenella mellea]
MSASTPSPEVKVPHLYGGRVASHRLHVIIIGGGIGGLSAAYTLASAGHTITLLESASVLAEVGAGVHISPNATRLLFRWGLREKLAAVVSPMEGFTFRRGRDGAVLGYTRFGSLIETKHGSPYCTVHRVDLHAMLAEIATTHENVTIRLNSTVVGVDPEKPTVTLADGSVVKGDLVVGADGLKSMVRDVVVGRPDRPNPTGDGAYRAVIPTDVMENDLELVPFLDTPDTTVWLAESRHVVSYCVRGRKEFNLVFTRPDDGAIESWRAEGKVDDMMEEYAGFEPRVIKLISQIKNPLRWRLVDREPLETWVHPDGRVVLLGDACHPMLPYRAQGATMALEDAAVLGNVLSHLPSLSLLHPFMDAYQKLRHSRTSATQLASRQAKQVFHIPEGPKQVARDANLRERLRDQARQKDLDGGFDGLLSETVESEDEKKAADNHWADEQKNIEQYSYDADEAVDRWWAEEGEALSHAVSGN